MTYQNEWTSPDGRVRLICADCLEVLPELEADCIITDPPYGISADRRQSNRAGKQHGAAMAQSRDYGESNWDGDRPSADTFAAMRRASRHQVIFGGNYFADMLPPSSSWLVWDKDNGANGYADFELAWTSHKRAARKIRWRWHGMLQEPGEWNERVHPTQKPTGVMVWVVKEYTDDDAMICDPFAGSCTTAVACIRTERKCIAIERERKYWEIGIARCKAEYARTALFDEVSA
jgi:DNA modification methylase